MLNKSSTKISNSLKYHKQINTLLPQKSRENDRKFQPKRFEILI